MTQLYQTWLKDSQTTTSEEGIRAQIEQQGLLQAGGTATEKIASDSIDLVVNGQWRFGETFSKKYADGIESLGESEYSGVPLYSLDGESRNAGYYEVEQVDVSPVHPSSEDVFEYTAGLRFRGTKEDVWTGVETSIEDVQTGIATGSDSLIGLPSAASKVRWFSESAGKEAASASSTVQAEYGSVDLYDPSDTAITNPILLYELDYEDTGQVDVLVYDDRGKPREFSVSSGGTTVEENQWTHAYHTSYEYDGTPIVDNGLLRVRFDEPNSLVEAHEWDTGTSSWTQLTVNMGDYELVDADFQSIGPSDTRVYTEWLDTADDRLEQAQLSIQRGLDRAVARYPPNTTQTSGLESVLSGFVGDYATDNKPRRKLKARGEVQ